MIYDRGPVMFKLTILRQKQGRGTGGLEEEDMVGIDAKVTSVVLTLGGELAVFGIQCWLTIGFTRGLTGGTEKERGEKARERGRERHELIEYIVSLCPHFPSPLPPSFCPLITSILTGSQCRPSSIGLTGLVRTRVDSLPSYSGRRSCSHCSTAGTQTQGTLRREGVGRRI
jgi:hypothetical protein